MPTMLIYIIRCKGYLRLTPYIWEVEEKGLYARCIFFILCLKFYLVFLYEQKKTMYLCIEKSKNAPSGMLSAKGICGVGYVFS